MIRANGNVPDAGRGEAREHREPVHHRQGKARTHRESVHHRQGKARAHRESVQHAEGQAHSHRETSKRVQEGEQKPDHRKINKEDKD